MTRGDLARRTGCHLETIRYYEHSGLLPDPPRTAAGHRRYDEGYERRLRFVLRGRELGFTIDDLRRLLSLVDRQRVTCGEVKAAAVAHLEDVRRKITDLRRIERALAGTVARCRGGTVPECPVVDALAGPPGKNGLV